MSASAAALSERDISYPSQSPDANAPVPVGLEAWKAELWRRAELRLQEYSTLKDDWDGAGAVAPSGNALAATAAFLRRVYAEGAIPPTALAPSPLGTIVLEWRLNDLYVEAEIADWNAIGWMKRNPDGSFRIWES